ncbi:MAG TPA: DegV family protein [Actinomycetota bacterium]
MTVAVITDGAASLPDELARDRGVTVVPLEVTIGGHAAGDGGPVPLEEVVRRLGDGVRTSSPPPGRFAAAIRRSQDQDQGRGGDGVLILTVARSMSSTYQAAALAARQAAGASGPGFGPVEVLDTGTAAGGQGLVVLAAAQAAQRGRPLGEVAAAARTAAGRVRLVATLDNLDQLVAGGRLPRAVGRLGTLLGVQPLFEFSHGGIHPRAPAFSRAAARRRILARWRSSRPRGPAALHVAALHALAPHEAESLLGAVRAELGTDPATAFIGEFGAAMVAHTGPNLTGLSWYWEGEPRV